MLAHSSNYILGGVDAPNMREEILAEMRRQGKVCRCIRCRRSATSAFPQIKNNKEFKTKSERGRDTRKCREARKKGGEKEAQKYKERSRASRDGVLARRASEKLAERAVLIRRTYAASHGEEHFLSFETPDEATIFGFVRLRLSANAGAGAFSSLEGCALIREPTSTASSGPRSREEFWAPRLRTRVWKTPPWPTRSASRRTRAFERSR